MYNKSKKIKILFVLAAGKLYREAVKRDNPYRYYAPTTLIQLAALVPKYLNAEVKIVDQGCEVFSDDFNADIIGISTITCAAPEAYRIAKIARKRGITVIMGGYHPSLNPDEALKYADSVVVGYAENTLPKLLIDYKNNKLKRLYRDTSKTLLVRMPELDRKYLSKTYFPSSSIETTRGCPNGCKFCSLPPMVKNRYWTRPVDEIINEIKTMGKNIVFLDSNHTVLKSHYLKLWKEMENLKVNWYAATTLQFASETDNIKLIAKSGCKGLLLGFESLNQESLNTVNKKFNNVTQYKEIIKKLHDYGIGIIACIVFGFDYDGTSIFEKTVQFVNDTKIDIIKYAILTPFPGTPLFNDFKKKNRIITEDWSLYDTLHAVYIPKKMSPYQLEQGLQWSFDETYKIKSILNRIFRRGSPLIHSTIGNVIFKRTFSNIIPNKNSRKIF